MNIYQKWSDSNPAPATKLQVQRWMYAEDSANKSMRLLHDADDWLADRSLPSPNMVKCVALYGLSWIMTGDWKKLPIDIPEHERSLWQEAGFEPTLKLHRDMQGANLGGLLESTGKHPDLFSALLRQQLADTIAELGTLLARPLDDYTPEDWDQVLADGFDYDDGQFVERREFNEPFELYEDLICFASALEEARLRSLTGHVPELGLPNPALHKALMTIDLNDLHRTLDQFEPKLRRIFKHLLAHNYRIDIDWMPDWFWWRHDGREVKR